MEMNALSTLQNEGGSALVVALLMLVVLSLLGISATNTSEMEIQISGSDKLYKMAFYEAENGAQAGCELVEQNIEERDWTVSALSARGNVGVDCIKDAFDNCINRDHAMNSDIGTAIPSDVDRHAFIPAGHVAGSSEPHTNILMGGNTALSTGSAVQLAAGYEGAGRGAGGGGALIIYDIRSQHEGVKNSSARINLQWRHVM